MTRSAQLASALLGISIVAGALADRVPAREVSTAGGYLVLAADFHTHSSTWSDGALTPWGLVLEAQRQGLDAIAITGHQQVSDAKAGRWFSSLIGGPTVLVGQEIISPHHHVVALGTERVITSPDLITELDDARSQGGITIAVHPTASFAPAFGPAAIDRLDAAEICHPLVYGHPEHQREFAQFREGRSLAAIGSSDFHGLGRMGVCRTYVFATANTAAAILDAIRARRTVVYTPDAGVFGDPALASLLESRPEFREAATIDSAVSGLDWISRIAGVLGLIGLVECRGRGGESAISGGRR